MICVIDCYSLFFRAYYGMPLLTTSTGQPIGAIYGFLRILFSLLKDFQPDYLLIAADSGGRTFRDDFYDDYLEQKFIKELFEKNQAFFSALSLEYNHILDNDVEFLIEKFAVNVNDFQIFQQSLLQTVLNNRILLLLFVLGYKKEDFVISDYKSQYKANRKEIPDDFKSQFAILYEFLEASGMKYLSLPKYEADDIIASYVRVAKISSNLSVRIISQDKDLYSLVCDNVMLYDSIKKAVIDKHGVLNKFGVLPSQIGDYLSLVGDASDNIPGVPRIGQKIAVNLLEKFGNLNGVLDNIKHLPAAIKSSIEANIDLLQLSKKLVTLHDKIDISIEDTKFDFNHKSVVEFCKKYEIKINIPQFKTVISQHNATSVLQEQQSLFDD
jgi:5'-3' exonuclease